LFPATSAPAAFNLISMQLAEPHPPATQRILSLDAYRGLIMLLLAGSDCFLGLHLPDRAIYNAIAFQFEHHPWGAISFYDLIMPAFLLMVGVAMSFSIGRRLSDGAKKSTLFIGLLRRALVLLLLSQLVTSVEQRHLDLQLHNILAHIAIISLLCFFLMQLPSWTQALIAILLLALHSALYLHFTGADGAFQPITNFGAVLDRLLMGHNYTSTFAVNLNILAEVPNVLAGIWLGELLRSKLTYGRKLLYMLAGIAVSVLLGLLISPIVPVNKWLWTASYALIMIGCSVLGFVLFFILDSGLGLKRPFHFLTIIGMNSLLVYCMGEMLGTKFRHLIALGTSWASPLGELLPILQATLAFALIYLTAWWLDRKKIYLRA